MSIWGNLDGTFRSRFSIGKKADEVYAERDGSNNLALRDLVVTTAQKLVDIISRTRTSQLAGLTEATSAARLDLLLLELASGGALRKITKQDLVRLPTDYLDGLGVRQNATNPTYQIDILPGLCRSSDNGTDLFNVGTLTADITVTGANGRDAGSEAANTWYHVWIIYNATTDTYAALLSTSSTAPTMPSGYTHKRRVGVVRNDGSSNFRPFAQVVNVSRVREYHYDEVSEATLEVLTAGTATTWTDVNLSSLVPSTSTLALLLAAYSCDNAPLVSWLELRPNGTSIANPVHRVYNATDNAADPGVTSDTFKMRTDASQVIEYQVNAENAWIWVKGFVDIV